ncbi:MAG TPA: nucleotidyl transferase AbiEii/AbiGii toxin family protein [Trebonia sp.]|jgi:hypothetical protein
MNGDRPTRASTSGRVFLDLRKLARTSGRNADEILRLYALEGLLARLVISRPADFALKGDILLAAYGIRHSARGIDIQPAHPYADARAVIQEAAGLDIDDGLYFGAESATAREVRGDDERKAVRVEVPFELNTVRATLRADIAAASPVRPASVPVPRVVTVPGLLGRDVVVSGYPLALLYAEKIVTAIDRGPATMRWRDFADIYALSALHSADGSELAAAVRHEAGRRREAGRREVALRPLADVLGAWVGQPRPGWMVWRRKQRLDGVPLQFPEVLDGVIAFTDPVLDGRAAGAAWRPGRRLWVADDGACSGNADGDSNSVRGPGGRTLLLGVRPAAPSSP